jgi:alcohol dehydrogenase class IV
LGVHCRVAHGLACAVMLPVAIRMNRHVRQAELARLARVLFKRNRHAPRDETPHAEREEYIGSDEEAVDVFIAKISALCDRVGVPRRLSQLGVRGNQIPALVRDSRGSSMSGNPRDLSDVELTKILEELL